MQVITIVGARPQFIKAAQLSEALKRAGHEEFLIHTGQHYDLEMSRVFFDELPIPEPDVNLEVGSGPHGWQTAQMLAGIEEILLSQPADYLVVYGDTNSTLAGALAACKLHLPLVHIEAGLRSYNRQMPEEHNRVVTDHLSDLLFCPSHTAVSNLKKEGIVRGVYQVGDLMHDSIVKNLTLAEAHSRILPKLRLEPGQYALVTVHRADITEKRGRLQALFQTFEKIAANGLRVVMPAHPRTSKALQLLGIAPVRLQLLKPVSYLDMLALEKHARVIVTDSGGVQKEAYWLGVPCVTLRTETEWLETVASGWNVLVGCEDHLIIRAVDKACPGKTRRDAFGDGRAAERIVAILSELRGHAARKSTDSQEL
ncbi:MAG: UDP-N-acetylglucosamine 2-epimerase (non-hydrolyzing) [Deltaproteobacteria bacterium]|nr:UDP-N-acetylglucosamine 2-epimerase (non-hydrolyzing) [Deltaproteobacteria bacterium]MBW2071186.1 UDP-N-acetylglucosamine 2-epimerase (non-hydrolyzing) [Deltaproteobacteria bacterium]